MCTLYSSHLSFSFLQLSPYFEREGEYGLSVDADVAFWMDSMIFQGKTPPREACSFVIVDGTLHDQFDLFKRDLDRDYSIFEYIELLQLWVDSRKPLVPPVLINKYGKLYIKLNGEEVDSFVVWLKDTRDRFNQVGQAVFADVSHNKTHCVKLMSSSSSFVRTYISCVHYSFKA